MSYILDALKRADADRERGHVPGLHSQASGPATSHPHPALGAGLSAWSGRTGPLVLVLSMAVLLGALGWWWLGPSAEPAARPVLPSTGAPPLAPGANAPGLSSPAPATRPPAQPAVEAAVASAPSQAAPTVGRDALAAGPVLPILTPPEPAAAAPSPAAGAPAAPNSPTTARTGATPPIASAPGAQPSVTPGTTPAATPADSTGTSGASAPPAPAAAAPAPAATAAVRRFAELPADVRAQLPSVSVNGSTYSQNPAHRMLIANGKVVQEGGDIAPGLKLETIGPRGAVLNHQGLRYSIAY